MPKNEHDDLTQKSEYHDCYGKQCVTIIDEFKS